MSNIVKKSKVPDNWYELMEYDAVKDLSPEKEDKRELTEKQENALKKHFAHLKTGMHSMVPIRCGGAGMCPFSNTCPLATIGMEPIGEPCPIEKDVVIESTKAYIREFNIDPLESFSKYKLILMLSRLDVYEYRAAMQLGRPDAAELIQQNAIGITPSGEIAEQVVTHKALEILDMLEKKRLTIMKSLAATPEAEWKKEAALKSSSADEKAAMEYAKIKAAAGSILSQLTVEGGTETVIEDEG